MKWLASLLPRELRAILALLASIGGAAVLTGFAAWVVTILRNWKGFDELRIHALSNALYGLLFIVGIVLVSLGLAINKRSVKATGPLGLGFDASGGDDDTPAAPSPLVTTTTTVTPPTAPPS